SNPTIPNHGCRNHLQRLLPSVEQLLAALLRLARLGVASASPLLPSTALLPLLTFCRYVKCTNPLLARWSLLRECECSIQHRSPQVPKHDNAPVSHESISRRNPGGREATIADCVP